MISLEAFFFGFVFQVLELQNHLASLEGLLQQTENEEIDGEHLIQEQDRTVKHLESQVKYNTL